ncbi:MAG: 4Fe-4S single cluster domain-containing protein [Eubacteriales bacterium]|jgi:anaerobic ribonucleoside-triphosphate reductase activating protein
MYIARVLYPVEVLGPGMRICIWTCGCPHKCEGCANPELWEVDESRNIKIPVLLDLIQRIVSDNQVNGFTITGGEPFFQKEELKALLASLSDWSEDILVYTGYYKEQLRDLDLEYISVLIDGPYIKEKNNGLTLRGSSNQRIHILDERYKELYASYLSKEHSRLQNFLDGTSVISVGIHQPDFAETIGQRMEKRGLIEGGTQKDG